MIPISHVLCPLTLLIWSAAAVTPSKVTVFSQVNADLSDTPQIAAEDLAGLVVAEVADTPTLREPLRSSKLLSLKTDAFHKSYIVFGAYFMTPEYFTPTAGEALFVNSFTADSCDNDDCSGLPLIKTAISEVGSFMPMGALSNILDWVTPSPEDTEVVNQLLSRVEAESSSSSVFRPPKRAEYAEGAASFSLPLPDGSRASFEVADQCSALLVRDLIVLEELQRQIKNQNFTATPVFLLHPNNGLECHSSKRLVIAAAYAVYKALVDLAATTGGLSILEQLPPAVYASMLKLPKHLNLMSDNAAAAAGNDFVHAAQRRALQATGSPTPIRTQPVLWLCILVTFALVLSILFILQLSTVSDPTLLTKMMPAHG